MGYSLQESFQVTQEGTEGIQKHGCPGQGTPYEQADKQSHLGLICAVGMGAKYEPEAALIQKPQELLQVLPEALWVQTLALKDM